MNAPNSASLEVINEDSFISESLNNGMDSNETHNSKLSTSQSNNDINDNNTSDNYVKDKQNNNLNEFEENEMTSDESHNISTTQETDISIKIDDDKSEDSVTINDDVQEMTSDSLQMNSSNVHEDIKSKENNENLNSESNVSLRKDPIQYNGQLRHTINGIVPMPFNTNRSSSPVEAYFPSHNDSCTLIDPLRSSSRTHDSVSNDDDFDDYEKQYNNTHTPLPFGDIDMSDIESTPELPVDANTYINNDSHECQNDDLSVVSTPILTPSKSPIITPVSTPPVLVLQNTEIETLRIVEALKSNSSSSASFDVSPSLIQRPNSQMSISVNSDHFTDNTSYMSYESYPSEIHSNSIRNSENSDILSMNLVYQASPLSISQSESNNENLNESEDSENTHVLLKNNENNSFIYHSSSLRNENHSDENDSKLDTNTIVQSADTFEEPPVHDDNDNNNNNDDNENNNENENENDTENENENENNEDENENTIAQDRIEEKKKNTARSMLLVRRNVVREICSVEKLYNQNLCVLLDIYLRPIEQIQPDPVISGLLSDILDIQQPHNILLNDLMTTTGADTQYSDEKIDNAPIGKIFRDISPYLKVYLSYMSTHSQISLYLSRASKKLTHYLNECINKPECKQRDFNSYSTMPIQQIPRYQLLIKRLIDNTPADHPDLPNLTLALQSIVDVATKCNQGLADEQARGLTLKIHTSLNQVKDIPPSRVLVKCGDLRKKNHFGKIEYCTFFLWNDCLMYASRAPNKHNMYQTGKYRNTIYFGPGISCRASSHNELMFYIQGWIKDVILLADTAADKDTWVQLINNVIIKSLDSDTKGKRNEFYLSPNEIHIIIKTLTDKTPEELFGENYEQAEIGKILRTQLDVARVRKEYKRLCEFEASLKEEESKMGPNDFLSTTAISYLDEIKKCQNNLIHCLKIEDYLKQKVQPLEGNIIEDVAKNIVRHHRHSFSVSTLVNNVILSSCNKCGTKFGVLTKPYNCPCCGRKLCFSCFSKHPLITPESFKRDLTNRCAECIVTSRESVKSYSHLNLSSTPKSHDGINELDVNDNNSVNLDEHVGYMSPRIHSLSITSNNGILSNSIQVNQSNNSIILPSIEAEHKEEKQTENKPENEEVNETENKQENEENNETENKQVNKQENEIENEQENEENNEIENEQENEIEENNKLHAIENTISSPSDIHLTNTENQETSTTEESTINSNISINTNV